MHTCTLLVQLLKPQTCLGGEIWLRVEHLLCSKLHLEIGNCFRPLLRIVNTYLVVPSALFEAELHSTADWYLQPGETIPNGSEKKKS